MCKASCNAAIIGRSTVLECWINIIQRMSVAEAHKKEEVRQYNPNKFLDSVRDKLQLKSDAALCRTLEVHSPLISKIRHGRSPVSAALLIRLHEVTGLNISDLRFLLGDRRSKFRISDVEGKRKRVEAVNAD
jgi:plasmid maintenance system antidote protein VapI